MTDREHESPADEPAKSGSVWAGLLLLGITCVFLFGVLEIAFRLLEPSEEPDARPGESWAAYDEELAYRNRPGWGDHNGHGLRDDPISDPKDRFRILIVGDSVPYYGDDIADTFPGRLEAVLQSDPRIVPSEVLNGGTRGYTNYQQTRWAEKYGFALAPDAIGISFILNDLHHILHRFKVVDGEIVGQEYDFSDEAVASVDSPVYRLLRKSHLLVWLRHRLSIFDDLIALYASDGFAFDYRPDFSTAWQPEPWETVESQLAALVEAARARGVRVFFVVFPFGEQLRPEALERDRDYVLYPQRQLAAIGQRLDVPVLDLFESLDLEADLDPDLIHLTPRGRGIAADEIAKFLIAEGLVPQEPASPPRTDSSDEASAAR